ncbi:MAG: Flp pilus assembly protein CpaB [Acidimicrobiia bacterium]
MGFLTRRMAALMGAVFLAGLATFALTSYVQGIETRTLRGAELVQTFIAKDEIVAGMSGKEAIADGLIVKESVPRKVVAEDVIRSLKDIEKRVAAVNIKKGEQIIASRFVAPTEARGILPIPSDKQAMAVETDVPPGVAGFVQAGDRVSIIAQLEVENFHHAQYLLQNIQVLAVGQRIVTSEEGEGTSKVERSETKMLLTLAVNREEAEKLAWAVAEGDIYFTLVPPSQQPGSTSGRNFGNTFSEGVLAK